MQRAFVYATAQSSKPCMALMCDRVDQVEAKVDARVKLASIKPGMIFCLGTGRMPDKTTARAIGAVAQSKTGTSTITFALPKVSGAKSSKG